MPIPILIIVIALLVIVDQTSKILVQTYLWNGEPLTVIPQILQFRYIENTGAAFSLFDGKTAGLIAFTSVLIIAGICLLLAKKIPGKINQISVSLIVAGGIGNLIDRIFRKFVIDFMEFTFVDFAVFNFADCCVTIGAVLLIFAILFDLGTDRKKDVEQK